ncbi:MULTISPECIES: NUDIX hydrolase [unclassified Gemella]|uniref:NUDIX hydrolase n=1 Tax=unclassified Gemella TaxID=2624949 RepID=UPI0015D08CEE|nr:MULTISPECIES: NUDIX hydrolase [unclassified Gemella]MBF0709843.1 NUDIX hydrolase [Gemella sp. GL1.1]MBF0746852.1 NUDIX hydrolase [Gemella sp. 19428wG2_WT2a]NYS27187.1 NUDIX hydrolase [Gemella sp. GL1]
MLNFEEKTINKKVIFDGKVLKLEVHNVELTNGEQSVRELIYHKGAVAILAVTDKDEVLLVEQYRKAVEQMTLEIPAGKLDPDEERITCAIRELKEETGYLAKEEDVIKIYDTHLAIGYSSELITLFAVENLSDKDKGELSLDEDEFINVRKYKLEDAFKLIDDNVITDSKTLLALGWLRNKRRA